MMAIDEETVQMTSHKTTLLAQWCLGNIFLFRPEFLDFREYFLIYVSHDPNDFLFDKAMLEQHFSYLGPKSLKNVYFLAQKIFKCF